MSEEEKKTIKRAMSAYVLYINANRPEMNRLYPGIKFGDIAKLISQKWGALTQEEKQPFIDLSIIDEERYNREVQQFPNARPRPRSAHYTVSTSSRHIPKFRYVDSLWKQISKKTQALNPITKIPYFQTGVDKRIEELVTGGCDTLTHNGEMCFEEAEYFFVPGIDDSQFIDLLENPKLISNCNKYCASHITKWLDKLFLPHDSILVGNSLININRVGIPTDEEIKFVFGSSSRESRISKINYMFSNESFRLEISSIHNPEQFNSFVEAISPFATFNSGWQNAESSIIYHYSWRFPRTNNNARMIANAFVQNTIIKSDTFNITVKLEYLFEIPDVSHEFIDSVNMITDNFLNSTDEYKDGEFPKTSIPNLLTDKAFSHNSYINLDEGLFRIYLEYKLFLFGKVVPQNLGHDYLVEDDD